MAVESRWVLASSTDMVVGAPAPGVVPSYASSTESATWARRALIRRTWRRMSLDVVCSWVRAFLSFAAALS